MDEDRLDAPAEFAGERLRPQAGVVAINVPVVVPVALVPGRGSTAAKLAGEILGPGSDIDAVHVAVEVGIAFQGEFDEDAGCIDRLARKR